MSKIVWPALRENSAGLAAQAQAPTKLFFRHLDFGRAAF
jgi:hypothetical protein